MTETSTDRRLPADPAAFLALAERATNHNDTDWPMSIYADDITLELVGDGIHQVHRGRTEAKRALEILYGTCAAAHARIEKTLVATTGDTLVNEVRGTFHRGRQATLGAEIWRFDGDGLVVHNIVYTSVGPRPRPGIRQLLVNPRLALAYATALIRRRQEPAGSEPNISSRVPTLTILPKLISATRSDSSRTVSDSPPSTR